MSYEDYNLIFSIGWWSCVMMSMQLRFKFAPDCSDKQHSALKRRKTKKFEKANDKDFINEKVLKKNEDEDFTEEMF